MAERHTHVDGSDHAGSSCGGCPAKGVTVKFNPFAFTIEQNNEFLAKGYEPIIDFDPRYADRETD